MGLGNPGPRYARTRHNAGFMVLDEVARQVGAGPPKRRYGALLAFGRHGSRLLALLWPQTFMNEAGRAVSPARGELQLPPERVAVVHDELDLPFGEVRVKFGGGLAGHNGLKSVAAHLGSREFWRVRVGIGRPPTTDPQVVSSYVLAPFGVGEEELAAVVEEAATRLLALVGEDEEDVGP